MLLTPHVAAGVAIASVVPDPRLAIPLAFLSHFVLDAVPHWDDVGLGRLEHRLERVSSRTFRAILLDALLALSFVLISVYWAMPDYGAAVTVLFTALAAALPDLYYLPLVFFGKRWGWVMWVVRLQSRVQTNAKASKTSGLLSQTALVAACLLVVLWQIQILLPQVWKIP
ncbi:MAG: hypothetical protein BMS9Abin34_139 [Patescibacteria group bacterium]|nr:MAG: hypothetical protein BMS9Abin34_139 [Patescibacteria group bacterium]